MLLVFSIQSIIQKLSLFSTNYKGLTLEHHFIGVVVIVTSLTDTSLTHSNVASLLSSVSVDWLVNFLRLSLRVSGKIFDHCTDEDQRRDQLIHYWRNTSPEASWTWLAGELYHEEETTALTAAKRFVNRAPGEGVACALIRIEHV